MADQNNDATRQALERIAKDGSDLSRPLQMDFFVAVPDEKSGHVVAARASKLGFGTSVEQDVESHEWTCYCTTVMMAAFESVVAIEAQLDSLASDVGGHADGFGTFGNAIET